MTLDQVSLTDFKQCLGEPFQMEHGGRTVAAELATVTGLGFNSARGQGRESFSLLFHAPKQWVYPQGIYRVTHPKLGVLEIFLVPLGPDDKGMRLEAIFNFM